MLMNTRKKGLPHMILKNHFETAPFCTFLSYFLLLSLLDGAISNHEQIVKTWEERLDKWSETEYKYLQGNH